MGTAGLQEPTREMRFCPWRLGQLSGTFLESQPSSEQGLAEFKSPELASIRPRFLVWKVGGRELAPGWRTKSQH